jgi:hypothetical protein
MATGKNTSGEYAGYPSARDAAAAEATRVSALVESIGYLSELLEDRDGAGDVFPLATAIQAIVESAQRHGELVANALDSMKQEASHA